MKCTDCGHTIWIGRNSTHSLRESMGVTGWPDSECYLSHNYLRAIRQCGQPPIRQWRRILRMSLVAKYIHRFRQRPGTGMTGSLAGFAASDETRLQENVS